MLLSENRLPALTGSGLISGQAWHARLQDKNGRIFLGTAPGNLLVGYGFSMEIYGKVPLPSADSVRKIFELVRREKPPLAPSVVADHYTLLLLPFAQLVEPFEERSHHIQAAVELASRQLADNHRLVIREVLLRDKGLVTDAREKVAEALGLSSPQDSDEVQKLEAEAFLALAKTLVSDVFADEFAEHVLPTVQQRLPPHQPGVTFVRRCFALDLSDVPRALVAHQYLQFHVTASEQRTLGIGYFTSGPPQPNEVEMLSGDDGHTYLGSKPDLVDGKPDSSWMHFFHLGQVRTHGEDGALIWREHYADHERTMRPYLTVVARPAQEMLCLAIRLPDRHRALSGRITTVFDPYGPQRKVLEEWSVQPDQDGWVVQPFANPVSRVQYGIFFPGLDLYAQ